tara:strand:- start:9305 stop:9451 length:147 start_codon:yes stop_codon:yes gene_type:complete
MLAELREAATGGVDKVALLRAAYIKYIRDKAKEEIETLTDEQILSGEF